MSLSTFFQILAFCFICAWITLPDKKGDGDVVEQVSPVALPSSPPVDEVKAAAPAIVADMSIQPGPCEEFPGTIQIVANVCDDGRGSFFVRLNPNDTPQVRIAHLMERMRSYKLDFLNRRILSVTPVTDTMCVLNVCTVIMYGAYGRYEILK